MASVRLNIPYKCVLLGVCLFAALWSYKCEAETLQDTHANSEASVHPPEELSI